MAPTTKQRIEKATRQEVKMKKKSDEYEKAAFARQPLTVYSIRLCAFVLMIVLQAICLSTIRASAQDSFSGRWTTEPADEANLLNLSLTDATDKSAGKKGKGESTTSIKVTLNQLRGLTQAQMMSAGSNVRFQFVRDAGTFNCEGWFKGYKGAGHYLFASSPTFVAELRRRDYETPTEAQLFSMAINDVSLAFIEELKAQGYERPTLDQLVRLGEHGVSFSYLNELKTQGYSLTSLEQLTQMVDHGVSLRFIKDMDALGYKNLPVEALIKTVDHGVTPVFIKELEAFGHSNLPVEQLTRLVDHGVNSHFLEKVKSRGFNNLTIDELIKLANQGFKD